MSYYAYIQTDRRRGYGYISIEVENENSRDYNASLTCDSLLRLKAMCNEEIDDWILSRSEPAAEVFCMWLLDTKDCGVAMASDGLHILSLAGK